MQAKYCDLLRQFRTLNAERLGAQCSDAQACDASSQHSADPVGDRHIRLGDACFSVDPLSSQGVHLALQSGLQGAIVVNTMLRRSGNSDVAQRFFRTRVAGLIDRYTSRTTQEYARVAAVRADAFWQERAGKTPVLESESAAPAQEPSPCAPSDWVVVSPEVTIDAAPVLDAMFVEVRQVVRHPNIDDSGVAYVDGVDLARLLPLLPGRVAYRDIPNLWCGYVPPATGAMIASWLWNRRLLVPAR